MAPTRHINYKSDFVLRERFRDAAGNIVLLPDGVDFDLVYTVKHGHTFTASRHDGVYSNCIPDGDALLVIFKDHNLCEGTLRRELHLRLLNDLMPGGFQNVYYPADPAVTLWQFATDSADVVECDALAAYTRGLPFTFDDFTPAQLDDIRGPALDLVSSMAAKLFPDALAVSAPRLVTLGNRSARVMASLAPGSALQNIIYLPGSPAAFVNPDGSLVTVAPGVAVVHVVPALASNLARSVSVRVVAPSLRLAAAHALRIDRAGNIRLT